MAPVVPRVSGGLQITRTAIHACDQSLFFFPPFVCVSAQQSEEMSVSGEKIDERTQEDKEAGQ